MGNSLSNVLLKTKLYIPPVSSGIVTRRRLTGRLDESLTHKLTLVFAPAGFGKTTLVSEWIGRCGVPFAWLSLDESDNDPIRFLNYVIAALQSIDADIGRGLTGLMGSPDLPAMPVLVTVLINDLTGLPGPILLVLDDYHVIQNPVIHDTLTILLDHQPAGLHLILLTRQDPPFPIARLRARAQVLELGPDDLRFSMEETAAFLKTHLEIAPDEAVVATLHNRTEGWAAGLQLATLSLRGKTDLVASVEQFSGSHPYVFDYLLDEVLQQLPEATRSFLQQTAILERLNAELCDVVTGRQDSREVLGWLEHANLFLISLDETRQWYRYYQLFTDFLRTQLTPDQQRAFHSRAAHWLAGHGYHREAINHYLAAGEIDQAANIIGQASRDLLRTGEFVTLIGWLDALPDELVQADSQLVTMKAWSLFLTGHYDEGAGLVAAIDRKLFSGEMLPSRVDPISLGRLRLLQAYIQRMDTGSVSIAYIREAVELLGEEDGLFSMIAMIMLANDQTLSSPSTAIHTFRRVTRVAHHQENLLVEMAALSDMLAVLDMQGRRREALTIARDFLSQNVDAKGKPYPSSGPILIQSGWLAYAADNLQTAYRDILQGINFCRQLSLQTIIPQGFRFLGVTLSAMGHNAAAMETAGEARRLAEAVHDDLIAAVCAATEADLYLKLGQITEATLRLETLETLPWPPGNPYYSPVYLNQIKLLIAQNRIREAQSHLAILSRWAESLGYAGLLIPIRILQAQAAIVQQDQATARACLEQAMVIAAPQDYRRNFLDADPSIIQLLPKLRLGAPLFVDSLLAGLPKLKAQSPLVDPLTERELEVLRLIADDLTNQEIAERLVTAVSTVKKHINHIFNKLQARDRTQAIERARELGLL
jgi:ATP/maltotriose-dependent transcriptional regulator MalT